MDKFKNALTNIGEIINVLSAANGGLNNDRKQVPQNVTINFNIFINADTKDIIENNRIMDNNAFEL